MITWVDGWGDDPICTSCVSSPKDLGYTVITTSAKLGNINIATITNYDMSIGQKGGGKDIFYILCRLIYQSKLPSLIPLWGTSLENCRSRVEKAIMDWLLIWGVDKVPCGPVKITWEEEVEKYLSCKTTGKINGVRAIDVIRNKKTGEFGVCSLLDTSTLLVEKWDKWFNLTHTLDETKLLAESVINEWFAEAGLLL